MGGGGRLWVVCFGGYLNFPPSYLKIRICVKHTQIHRHTPTHTDTHSHTHTQIHRHTHTQTLLRFEYAREF